MSLGTYRESSIAIVLRSGGRGLHVFVFCGVSGAGEAQRSAALYVTGCLGAQRKESYRADSRNIFRGKCSAVAVS
jgi:hypothetical protein